MKRQVIAHELVAKYVAPHRKGYLQSNKGANRPGLAIALDVPIKDYVAYAANVAASLKYGGFNRPIAVMGNEGGAVIGALIAAHISPEKILEIMDDGFDPLKLIEGDNPITTVVKVKKNKKTGKLKEKVKLKGKKSSKVHGAQHKGRRFAEAIEEIIAKHIGLDKPTLASFNKSTRTPFYISALNEQGQVEYLSYLTYPNMLLADAIRASCAIQPLVARVAYTNSSKAVYKFASATPLCTLNYVAFTTLLKKNNKLEKPKARGLIKGFGWNNQINAPEYISKKSDYYHRLNQQRAAPVLDGLETQTELYDYVK